MQVEHLSGYQARDYDIVDYKMYRDQASGLWFRGPEPARVPGKYFTCLGAAQTLGCFCQAAYPDMVAEAAGLEAVNFGYGGAGPRFFLKYPSLIETVNAGRFAIVQVMSARSEDNSVYESGGLEYLTRRSTGEKLSADTAYGDLLSAHAPPASLPAPVAKAIRMFHAPKPVRDVLRETRSNWVQNYAALLSQITVPVVLLWFSKRRPGIHRSPKLTWWWQRYDNHSVMLGEFPQLVNAEMIAAIRPLAKDYVAVVSSRGSPQPLVNRFNGEPAVIDFSKDRPDFSGVTGVNDYYPSPEMQEDAAAALVPVVRELLGSGAT